MKHTKSISKGLQLSCLSITFGFLFCGCSFFGFGNGYVEFFTPQIPKEQVKQIWANGNFPNEIKEIKVINGNETDTLLNEYGCFYIGDSTFEDGLNAKNDPKGAARKVGANVYLNMVTYSHTVNGTYTTMMPTASTTRTTSNASAYGSGGFASGSGSSTSITYGSVPITQSYSIDRYNQSAMFFLCD